MCQNSDYEIFTKYTFTCGRLWSYGEAPWFKPDSHVLFQAPPCTAMASYGSMVCKKVCKKCGPWVKVKCGTLVQKSKRSDFSESGDHGKKQTWIWKNFTFNLESILPTPCNIEKKAPTSTLHIIKLLFTQLIPMIFIGPFIICHQDTTSQMIW